MKGRATKFGAMATLPFIYAPIKILTYKQILILFIAKVLYNGIGAMVQKYSTKIESTYQI